MRTHTTAAFVAGWLLVVSALVLTASNGTSPPWAVMTSIALLPPLALVPFWYSKTEASLSQQIQEALH